VLISTRSAIRDGRQLLAASRFAVDRPESVYLHLGYGLHSCLGDQVSRVQVPEIVRRILQIPGVHPSAASTMEAAHSPNDIASFGPRFLV